MGLLLKPDPCPFVPAPLSRVFVEQVFDAVVDLAELDVVHSQPFFDHCELCPHIVLLQEYFSYFDKRAHDGDVHLYGLIAVQYAAEHGDALFCKSVREISGAAADV